ncbi:hypothetical protein [Gordonia sp. VNK21]|uniref:hypothetical protein n=1 Tax=Gordonia sp. VNK21 TaxID=3382483 RepID=UPI0038D49962
MIVEDGDRCRHHPGQSQPRRQRGDGGGRDPGGAQAGAGQAGGQRRVVAGQRDRVAPGDAHLRVERTDRLLGGGHRVDEPLPPRMVLPDRGDGHQYPGERPVHVDGGHAGDRLEPGAQFGGEGGELPVEAAHLDPVVLALAAEPAGRRRTDGLTHRAGHGPGELAAALGGAAEQTRTGTGHRAGGGLDVGRGAGQLVARGDGDPGGGADPDRSGQGGQEGHGCSVTGRLRRTLQSDRRNLRGRKVGFGRAVGAAAVRSVR